MSRQGSAERLARAQAQWPDLAPILASKRVDTALVDRQCCATHVVPPYERLSTFVARVLEDAGRRVYQPLWEERRAQWARRAGQEPRERRVMEHRDEQVQTMVYHRQRSFVDPDFPPISLEEALGHEREMEQYTLDPMEHDGGVPLVATLVNTVNKATLRGGCAYVPWIREHDPLQRLSLLPVLAVHRTLLGLVCPYSSNRNRSFRIRYASPFGAMHAMFPLGNCIQETASTNNALGELAAQITTSMLRLAVGTETLEISMRKCNNRVFTMYMHRRVPFEWILRMFPQVAHLDGRFDGLMLQLPDMDPLRLLVFRKPIILVGTVTALAARVALGRFLPYVLNATEAEAAQPAAPVMVSNAKAGTGRKRKATTNETVSSSSRRPTKKRRLAMTQQSSPPSSFSHPVHDGDD